MKKVIEGKLYNTETATLIHEWDNGRYGGDFRKCEESLYRTKNDRYFLAGSGGPMSKYARPVGDMTGGGDGIEPVTEAAAQEWLEHHDGDEALLSQFKEKIEEA